MNDQMPTCDTCGRAADNPELGLELMASFEEVTVAEYARMDGTYNRATNRFRCDDCYIRTGMPSSPRGWMVDESYGV